MDDAFDETSDNFMDDPDIVSTINSRGKSLHLSDLQSVSARNSKVLMNDTISSRPGKRHMPGPKSQEKVQRTLRISIPRSIKGIGFVKPGKTFNSLPRTLKHDFSFEMASALGQRRCVSTYWRHGFAGYLNSDAIVLSPAASTTTRTIDSLTLTTAVRDGTSSTAAYSTSNYPSKLVSATSLWDLEAASWNANAIKMFADTGGTTSTAVPVATGYMQVYQDYYPATVHNKGTPFPAANSSVGGPQARPPFLVNLGPGVISFTCQNKVPTNAEVEFVVFQIKDDQKNSTGNWSDLIVKYSADSTLLNTQGPKLGSSTTQWGGDAPVSFDSVNDPDYKFLGMYPGKMPTRPPAIERERVKFILQGGAVKTLNINLPAQVYDSYKNAYVSGDPFAVGPDLDHQACNLQTYIIFVAINGVVMPVFTVPSTNNGANAITAPDHVNLSVVDRQAAAAAVMFTGSYIEHPRPCLSTPQDVRYDNRPLMVAPTTSTTGYSFIAGLVSSMPVNVATGNNIVFNPIGSTAQTHDTMGG